MFDNLLSKNYPVRLKIVSSLTYGDDVSKTTVEDFKSAKEIIAKYPNNIEHYEWLPNHEVLKLLASSHVSLLPTFADSYGYSVLEARCRMPCYKH